MAIALEVRGLTRMMELPPLSAATIARREAKFRAEREEYDRLHANDPTPPPPPVMPMLSDDTPRMKCIFSNVSFSLQRGTTLAIVGPAGCGKTQLLRVRPFKHSGSAQDHPETSQILLPICSR